MPLFDIALNSGFDDYIYFWSVNFDFWLVKIKRMWQILHFLWK
jgi:hypothetical protein